MNKLIGLLLAILFLAVANSWGACRWEVCFGGYEDCAPPVYNGSGSHCTQTCDYDIPSYNLGNCRRASYHYYQWRWGDTKCGTDRGWYYLSAHIEGLRCDNQCEADSTICVSDGNVWQDDASATCGKSCKINYCKTADSTWLSTSIAACTGSNNYAIVNTDSTCEHVGTCCPNDSIPSGNTCKWRCDSVLTQCNGRAGSLFGDVLPDTSVSGQDTTFSYQCFYNCAHSPNPDSTVYIVEGNTILAGPSDSIADGIKSEWFSSIRSTTGSIYVYDYLSPTASEYVDSIAAMKCVEHLWRCVINNKYVYWYDNQEVPAGCTNIVRVK